MQATLPKEKTASPAMVIIAFAVLYVVWGSTYFFIQQAVKTIPPLIMGNMRFFASGILLLLWCIIKGEKVWEVAAIKPAVVSGLFLLFIGNGAVIWAEQTLPSSFAAVLTSASPLWFVVLDKPKWKENFASRNTIAGVIVGFCGVILLFSEKIATTLSLPSHSFQLAGMCVVFVGSMSWAGGSLYSKYKAVGAATVTAAWQMLAAGCAFCIGAFISGEWQHFQVQQVTTYSWLSVLYLVFMGSLAGYSAFVWLLKVCTATQVSTHAYVNPVVAVLLGVFFAGEHMSLLQFIGLVIILLSVLLINISKYRKSNIPEPLAPQAKETASVKIVHNKTVKN